MKQRILSAAALVMAALIIIPSTTPQAEVVDKVVIEDLVVANRILSSEELGYLDTAGHVSIRSPTNPNHYFLARWIAPGIITANDIIEYDLDSKPVAGERKDQYLERYIHGEIYKARPDVNAVVHSHTRELVAFGASSVPLATFDRQQGGNFIRLGFPIWDIRKYNGGRPGIVETAALGKSLAKTLGKSQGVLLQGHGAVVVDSSLHGLVERATALRKSAQLEMQVVQMGHKIRFEEPATPSVTRQKGLVVTGTSDGSGGDRAWEYWKKKVQAQLAAEAKVTHPSGEPAKTRDELLVDLTRINRLLASERMSVLGTSGNVSVRDPTNPNHFFLSRDVSPAEVTPSGIVEYDLDGVPVGGPRADNDPERFIHSEIYKSRPDVMSVVHAPMQELVALGISGLRLRPIVNGGAFIGDGLPVFDINKYGTGQTTIASPALGRDLAQVLGQKPAVLTRDDGVVVVGPSVYDVMGRVYSLRINALIQQMAIGLGGRVTYLDAPIPASAPPASNQPYGEGAGRAWGYWVRQAPD